MALTAQQVQIVRLLEQLAGSRGLGPGRQREFAEAAMSESTLNPHARNPSSGAGGLFQLLSAGYRQTAQRLGGVNNPRANALAILPEYVRYWRQHPGAAPGTAAAAVEASGEGPGFYTKTLSQIPKLGGGVAGGSPPSLGPPRPGNGLATAPAVSPMDLANALNSQTGKRNPDYQQAFLVADQLHQHARTVAEQAMQGLTDGQHIGRQLEPGPNKFGKVTLAPGADRPGVRTSKAVLQFVARIAGLAGKALTIGTGSNHSEMTVSGRVSAHWNGNAADIPARGKELIRLGRYALIAAGMPPAQAMKQTGGLYNVGGHQIIFNTSGPGIGDHTTHLHVGLSH